MNSSKRQRLNWDNIETVLLDMDGTILDLHFDNYFWCEFVPLEYAKKHALEPSVAKERLNIKFKKMQGTLNWYCLDYWSKELQLDIVQLKSSIAHKISFRSDALTFLEFLRKRHKRVVLVTNAHPKSLEIKMLNADFHQYFDRLISSHQFGSPKEEQFLWIELQKYLKFDKKKTLFVDDSLSVLEAAKQYGIEYVFGIAQPDSKLPARSLDPFYTIDKFEDISE